MDQKVIFDVKGLLAAFGGPQAYRTACLAVGVEVPAYFRVRQWSSRGSAPGHAIATMLLVASRNWKGFDPYQFIRVEGPMEEAA